VTSLLSVWSPDDSAGWGPNLDRPRCDGPSSRAWRSSAQRDQSRRAGASFYRSSPLRTPAFFPLLDDSRSGESISNVPQISV